MKKPKPISIKNQRDNLYAALRNLLDRDLIKDIEGDHYEECVEVVREVEGYRKFHG